MLAHLLWGQGQLALKDVIFHSVILSPYDLLNYDSFWDFSCLLRFGQILEALLKNWDSFDSFFMIRLDVWSRGRKIMRQNDIFTRYVKNSSPILDTSLSWPSSSDFSPVKLFFILLSYLATIHCISLCLRKTKLCLFPSYIEFRIRLLVSMKYSTLVLIKTTPNL